MELFPENFDTATSYGSSIWWGVRGVCVRVAVIVEAQMRARHEFQRRDLRAELIQIVEDPHLPSKQAVHRTLCET